MLERAERASHIDPPASSYAIMQRASPYCGENPGPGKDVDGELEPRPGIRDTARVNRVGATRPTSSRDVRFTSNRVQTSAPQRIDVVCDFRTLAVQQNLLMMFQRRLSCVGQIGGHRFLRSVDNPR